MVVTYTATANELQARVKYKETSKYFSTDTSIKVCPVMLQVHCFHGIFPGSVSNFVEKINTLTTLA